MALLVAGSSRASVPEPQFPVIDLHVDLSYQYNFKGKGFAADDGQFSVTRARRGGVVGVVLPLFVPKRAALGPSLEDLERSYERVSQTLSHSVSFAPSGCVVSPGKLNTFFAFEGAGPLADQPESLARWQSRGLRLVGLVHTYANELASSSGDPEPKPFGLTERGRVLVRRAFALGLVVDVSHASDRAVTDVLLLAAESNGVVVASHSNARALADHPRNLTDAELRGIAATGGVIGVNFHSPFLARGRSAHLSDVVAELRYLVQVAGIDHVALGSDFEGDIHPPAELADASQFPRLARALGRAGFDERAIRKIFADNAWRVLCGTQTTLASSAVSSSAQAH